jgi:hypothetical protein
MNVARLCAVLGGVHHKNANVETCSIGFDMPRPWNPTKRGTFPKHMTLAANGAALKVW